MEGERIIGQVKRKGFGWLVGWATIIGTVIAYLAYHQDMKSDQPSHSVTEIPKVYVPEKERKAIDDRQWEFEKKNPF